VNGNQPQQPISSHQALAKQEIALLIGNYNRLVQENQVDKFNEGQTKSDFIEPLFEALGWDVRNKNHPSSLEVTREEKVSKGRVDYGFRLNGIVKFYLEAKPFREDIENEHHVKQTITYAWNRDCAWAVLTNFKGLTVFNAEWMTTDLSQNRVKTLDYSEFLNRFDELWLLSREAFERGLLDKAAEQWGKKTKHSHVGRQLLDDFTTFRETLSKNIAQRNRDKLLSQNELDESVQRILDRLIFIRYCEDKEHEESKLIPIVRDWDAQDRKTIVVRELRRVFTEYNENYDSEIFNDFLCDHLDIANEVLVRIIKGLKSPPNHLVSYDFSVIEADVLGSIYEQYLGHILRKSKKGTSLTENHVRRKEHGIYYTPTYVVDYIVRNTLGRKLDEKTGDLDDIRVLDPACGSGSFLIKAFDRLNEYHIAHDKQYAQSQLEPESLTGSYSKKVKILKENIFGVDIDKQAVQIAQLNLLLKIAEKKHSLPVLRASVLQGNSLIPSSLQEEDRPFDWKKRFPNIMNENRGGFDVIVGNPPYVRPHNLDKHYKDLLWKYFSTFTEKSDLYNCFMQQGIRLLRNGGYFSFIVPHTWTSLKSFYGIRQFVYETCKVLRLVQLPKKVFQEATVQTCIFVFQKDADKLQRENNTVVVERLNEKGEVEFVKQFPQSRIAQNYLYNFELYAESSGTGLFEKLKAAGLKLESVVDFSYGLKTGDDERFIADKQKNSDYKRLLRSKDIGRYSKDFANLYVWYVPELMIKHRKTARPGDKERFETEKIIVSRMGKREVMAVYDDQNYYVKDAMLLLKKDEQTPLKYITGILNSKVINYYYRNYFVTMDVLKNALLELPIVMGSESEQQAVSAHVDKLQGLTSRFNALRGKRTEEFQRLANEIDEYAEKIDQLVYTIYGISEDERKIIEKSLGLKKTSENSTLDAVSRIV